MSMQAAAGISAAMHEACAGLRGRAAAAVCGSKGTGKSTFGRLLLNALLNVCEEVAWLDTDCGQPEFTVPGVQPEAIAQHSAQSRQSILLVT